MVWGVRYCIWTWGLRALTRTQIHTADLTYSLTSNTLACMCIFTCLLKILFAYISKCPFLEHAYDHFCYSANLTFFFVEPQTQNKETRTDILLKEHKACFGTVEVFCIL